MEGPDFLEYLHKNMYRVIKAGLYLGFFTHMGRHAGSFCADLLFEACHKSRSINNKSALKELMELEV
jgi:hypothetical protein